MSNAFVPVQRTRPCPIFGRPVHPRVAPIDCSPILLLKPFGFRITPDTLSSSKKTRWPTGHYPRLWIQRPSSERRRDLNPPDSCAAQRTLSVSLTSTRSSDPSHLFGLAGPISSRLNRMDLPCSRCFLWLHAGGTNPGSTSGRSRCRGLRFRLPLCGIGSATPITIDFAPIFPFTVIPAYNLPVYASQRPLDESLSAFLGSTRAAGYSRVARSPAG